MTPSQYEEILRLKAVIQKARLRISEARTAVDRIDEELRETQVALMVIETGAENLPSLSAPTPAQPWVLPGGPVA